MNICNNTVDSFTIIGFITCVVLTFSLFERVILWIRIKIKKKQDNDKEVNIPVPKEVTFKRKDGRDFTFTSRR